MASNEDLVKRIEILEKEVQHLKAALQHQIKNKKKITWIAYSNLLKIVLFDIDKSSSLN